MWDIYFHFGFLLGALIVWGLKFRNFNLHLKLLGFVILATLLIEGYATILMLQRIRNLYLYHYLTPLQFSLFSYIFYLILEDSRSRKIILYSIPLYLLISFLLTLQVQGFSEYNSYALSLKNLLLTIWVLLYYRETFTSLKVVRLTRDPMFWISTGLLFYSLGSFFVDGLMHYVLGESFEMANALFYISIFLGYLLHGTFFIALILETKRSRYALEKAKS